jgi:transposase
LRRKRSFGHTFNAARQSATVRPESSGLDTCRTLSFCPSLIPSRFAGWKCLPGSGRRRAWTAEQKARIVAESHESGETVSAVARRHGLTAQQLFGWRRVAQGRAQGGSDEGGSAFAPVIVDAGAAYPQVPIAPVCSSGSPVIEVLIGAATVRVPPGSDAVILQAVLRILMAAT